MVQIRKGEKVEEAQDGRAAVCGKLRDNVKCCETLKRTTPSCDCRRMGEDVLRKSLGRCTTITTFSAV